MLSKLTSVFGEKFEKIVRFIRGDNKSRDKRFSDSDQEWVLRDRFMALWPLCPFAGLPLSRSVPGLFAPGSFPHGPDLSLVCLPSPLRKAKGNGISNLSKFDSFQKIFQRRKGMGWCNLSRLLSGAEGDGSCKWLSTCSQILLIQKAFLQRFMSYELLSVIKIVVFCYFSVEIDFLR